jgi:hypothetical protein
MINKTKAILRRTIEWLHITIILVGIGVSVSFVRINFLGHELSIKTVPTPVLAANDAKSKR